MHFIYKIVDGADFCYFLLKTLDIHVIAFCIPIAFDFGNPTRKKPSKIIFHNPEMCNNVRYNFYIYFCITLLVRMCENDWKTHIIEFRRFCLLFRCCKHGNKRNANTICVCYFMHVLWLCIFHRLQFDTKWKNEIVFFI